MNSVRKAPRGWRLHIGIFGRRNVGKSSLLNLLTRQHTSIVSEVAGTTTDPVEKPMELLPIGPVLFIDTAGIDDVGDLGRQRIEQTRKIISRTDLALLVTEAARGWGEFEELLLREFTHRQIPTIVVFNKADLGPPAPASTAKVKAHDIRSVSIDSISGTGAGDLRRVLIDAMPDDFLNQPTILGDLVPPGEMAVLVVPIDKEAPKGRLIMPQVQSIRDLLDHDAFCLITKERELRAALDRLKHPPALVVTDSQAFLKVAADTPKQIPMTSFSIVFARFKGDLEEFVRGALTIENLHPGAKILIAESCSHHPIEEDIGSVKIPRWLRQYAGAELEFFHCQGHDFPDDPSPYSLVIHCAGCVTNRREILSRVMSCRQASVPITNYGVAIAFVLGILERALSPFPAALETCLEKRKEARKSG